MSDFGNNQGGNNAQGAQQGGEKADWLDKGIEAAGDKAGVNIVRASLPHATTTRMCAYCGHLTEPEERGHRGRLREQGGQAEGG